MNYKFFPQIEGGCDETISHGFCFDPVAVWM